MSQQPEVPEELKRLRSAKADYVQKTIPTILAGLLAAKGLNSSPIQNVKFAAENVQALWDFQNPIEAETTRRLEEQLQADTERAINVGRLANKAALGAAIAAVKNVPSFVSEIVSPDDVFLMATVKAVINKETALRGQVDNFVAELHAGAPMGDSPLSDRFAQLLAEVFMDTLRTIPINQDRAFQERVAEAGRPVTYLRLVLDQVFRNYSEFLCSLPTVTASASIAHFASLASRPDILVVSAQYFEAEDLVDTKDAEKFPLNLLKYSLVRTESLIAKNLLALVNLPKPYDGLGVEAQPAL